MNNLQTFENKAFGKLTSLMIDGEPWFIGKEVAEKLGYQNASKALSDHVDNEDKLNNVSLLSLGQRGGWIINESGLYSLILSSKLPQAKAFKRWVTHEVLPAIRRTGKYDSTKLISSEYLKAAELIAGCEKERLPHVLNLLKNAGMQIQNIECDKAADNCDMRMGDTIEWNKCRRRMQGMTVRQIANKFNIPISTAYNYKSW